MLYVLRKPIQVLYDKYCLLCTSSDDTTLFTFKGLQTVHHDFVDLKANNTKRRDFSLNLSGTTCYCSFCTPTSLRYESKAITCVKYEAA